MRLHVHDSGSPDRSGREPSHGTVLFIHGFPFDGSIWSPQLSAMPAGWRGLAPDLRGFGRSELGNRPGEVSTGKNAGGKVALDSEPVLTMARMADDLAELLEAQAVDRAVVCGLSMGGYVAFELWRRHRDRVRGLVLTDTRAEADDDEGRENRMRMAQAARTGGARPIATSMLPALLSATTLEKKGGVSDRVQDMILGTAPETIIAALAGMAGRRDMASELPGIDVPALVLVGEHDEITPPSAGRRMAAAIPDAAFVEIPAAGHLPNLENPAAFNEAVASFLARLQPPPSSV